MKINHKKCIEFIEIALKLMKKTKELNQDEKKYILTSYTIALGKLELEELEKEKNEISKL